MKKRTEYIYYLALLPKDQVASFCSSIIHSSCLYCSFDWKTFSQYVSKAILIETLKSTILKLGSTSEEIKIAQ